MRSLTGNENALLKRDSYFSQEKTRAQPPPWVLRAGVIIFGLGKGTPASIGEIKPQHPNLLILTAAVKRTHKDGWMQVHGKFTNYCALMSNPCPGSADSTALNKGISKPKAAELGPLSDPWKS